MKPVKPEQTAQRIDNPFYSRVFCMVTITLLGFSLYQITRPFLSPLIWALLIAFLLHPLHLRLSIRVRQSESLSAFLLTCATFFVLVGPIAAMSTAFMAQTGDLVQWVDKTLIKQEHGEYRVLADLPYIEPVLHELHANLGIPTVKMQKWIGDAAQELPQFLSTLGEKIFLGAFNTALAFVVMLFMLFFFLRDGAEFVAMLRDLIPMTAAHREKLMDHMVVVTHAVVFGTGITAMAQGLLVGLAFLITGLSSPLVFGVLAALLALLPFGGTALVWIPATLILAGQAQWVMAIVMLAIGILSSTIDNVLRPLLISRRGEVGTLAVFVGVLGGAAAYGPIGFLLGPIILALIIALMRFALELRRP